MSELEAALPRHEQMVQKNVAKALSWQEKMLTFLDQDTLRINGTMSSRGMGALALKDRVDPDSFVPLNEVPDPLNEGQIGRFAWGFHMTQDYNGKRRIPIDSEHAQSIRTQYHRRDLDRFRDHRSRPSYYRSLTLFPGFFANLTVDISAEAKPPATYGPALFVAYNVMTRLVDERDPGVTEDGEIDRAYFHRPIPNFTDRHLRSVG